MASRKTLQEANELKAKLEQNNPGAVIVVIESVTESEVHPAAIEAQGLQDKIVRWEDHPSGEKYPVVRVEGYDILERKTCSSCGRTWNSLAIGEHEALCSDCLARARDPRSDEQVQADTARKLAREQAAEDWYQ